MNILFNFFLCLVGGVVLAVIIQVCMFILLRSMYPLYRWGIGSLVGVVVLTLFLAYEGVCGMAACTLHSYITDVQEAVASSQDAIAQLQQQVPDVDDLRDQVPMFDQLVDEYPSLSYVTDWLDIDVDGKASTAVGYIKAINHKVSTYAWWRLAWALGGVLLVWGIMFYAGEREQSRRNSYISTENFY